MGRGVLRSRVGFPNSAIASDLRFRPRLRTHRSDDRARVDAGSSDVRTPRRTVLDLVGELQRTMRSLRVVVRSVFGEHALDVSLAEGQHAFGEFGSDGQHERSAKQLLS